MEMSEFAIELSNTLRPRLPEGSEMSSTSYAAPSGVAFALRRSMLETVGESLCDAVDLGAGSKVLDLAGNEASLVAIRRGATVIARRAQDISRTPRPFADGSFDVVLSAFGTMRWPDDVDAPSELLRVCRHRGRIGIAHWTPNGFMGRLLSMVQSAAPAHSGWLTPTGWAFDEAVECLFCPSACDVMTTYHTITFRSGSAEEWVDELRTARGPVRTVVETVSAERRRRLERDLLYLIDDFNISRSASVLVPSEYFQVVIVRK